MALFRRSIVLLRWMHACKRGDSKLRDRGTDCGHGSPPDGLIAEFGLGPIARKPLARARTTENAPPGEARRFWGYYREERYVSLYMWIRGR